MEKSFGILLVKLVKNNNQILIIVLKNFLLQKNKETFKKKEAFSKCFT